MRSRQAGDNVIKHCSLRSDVSGRELCLHLSKPDVGTRMGVASRTLMRLMVVVEVADLSVVARLRSSCAHVGVTNLVTTTIISDDNCQ